jgi:hypothetical protein
MTYYLLELWMLRPPKFLLRSEDPECDVNHVTAGLRALKSHPPQRGVVVPVSLTCGASCRYLLRRSLTVMVLSSFTSRGLFT